MFMASLDTCNYDLGTLKFNAQKNFQKETRENNEKTVMIMTRTLQPAPLKGVDMKRKPLGVHHITN